MWEIIVSTNKKYKKLSAKRISFTYLHGKLEDDCKCDCYGFINCDLVLNEGSIYVNDSLINDGVYPCIYKKKSCSLYFWHCDKKPHGLVVYDNDLKSVEYAKKKFLEKSSVI